MMTSWRLNLAGAALALFAATATAQEEAKETPAEKIRKALDKTVTLTFVTDDADAMVDFLKEKTGVKFKFDRSTDKLPGSEPRRFELKADNDKLSTALRRMLRSHVWSYMVLEDMVQVGREEDILDVQLWQLVSVQVADVPLRKALKDLSRATPFNFVIDPRVNKEAQTPVTLDLENAQLEQTVRLLTELAGLKMVRLDNVLFVTTETNAEKLLRNPQAVGMPLNPRDFSNTGPSPYNGMLPVGRRVVPIPIVPAGPFPPGPIGPLPPPVNGVGRVFPGPIGEPIPAPVPVR